LIVLLLNVSLTSADPQPLDDRGDHGPGDRPWTVDQEEQVGNEDARDQEHGHGRGKAAQQNASRDQSHQPSGGALEQQHIAGEAHAADQ
jgi:hypothetical protein